MLNSKKMTTMREIQIGSTKIGRNHSPYFIAEISGNHLQSLERCINIVDETKKANASAVKVQTLDPEKITIGGEDNRFVVQNGPWRDAESLIFMKNMLPEGNMNFRKAKQWDRCI